MENTRPGRSLPRAGSHPKTNDKVFELVEKFSFDGIKILDLGAGRGNMAQRVSEFLSRGQRTTGSILAVDLVQEAFEAKGVPFEQWDLNEKFACGDSQYDLIYSIEVIEHLHNPYQFIQECSRVLKPGGRLILTTPNNLHIESRARFFLSGFPKLYEPPSIRPENAGRLCGHVMPIHAAYVDYGLRRSGFSVPDYHCDKTHGGSLFWFYALWPIWFALKARNLSQVKKYDQLVFEECKHALEAMASKTLLTARSLVVSAIKL